MEKTIPEYKIYKYWFDKDLKLISNCKSRGFIFSNLFHCSSSYFKKKYEPLDLITRILTHKNREQRSAFFRFLSGYCFLFTQSCMKCGFTTPDSIHFLLNCPFFITERTEYLQKVRKMLSNHFPTILPDFNHSITNDKKTAVLILFGANTKTKNPNGNITFFRNPLKPFHALNSIPAHTADFATKIISVFNS